MILDTSASVAILRKEPEADDFRRAIDGASSLGMSAASVLELAIVTGASGAGVVDEFLAALHVSVLSVDEEHLKWARYAHVNYGRGAGSVARLNFGDCLTYGAAKATGQPLLFKGDDFTHTDVQIANYAPE